MRPVGAEPTARVAARRMLRIGTWPRHRVVNLGRRGTADALTRGELESVGRAIGRVRTWNLVRPERQHI
jgi:hypothetical protein